VELRVAGPAPLFQTASIHTPSTQTPGVQALGAERVDVRTLLFIPYAQAATVTRVLRAAKAAGAARRTEDPVQLRLDGVDVL
jgi:primosomal protein N' (replication factor Y) (superfamily II helicase)